MKILFGFTCPGDQRGSLSRPTKDALFQSTCQLCRESHKTQVWLYFLVLSLLSTSTCVTSTPEIADLQTCVKKLRDLIEKSDAMLYAPSLNEVEVNCKNMSLKCYLLELIMVAEEEAVPDNRTACIFHFNETLSTEDGCPPCEAYSFENITTFLNRLNNLLEAMATRQQT
ncbi:uncharacterized protein LOC114475878 isoform X2 [Gouania willdenowi]|uniref:Interleukin n=1 Tax=Gouania willdenowi TaxID=441366 RepID=A0A8C5E7J5_GOUWI|nr:uncharacterized protein LOC114475878 isoform X2 [Gouania willdenowi]